MKEICCRIEAGEQRKHCLGGRICQQDLHVQDLLYKVCCTRFAVQDLLYNTCFIEMAFSTRELWDSSHGLVATRHRKDGIGA